MDGALTPASVTRVRPRRDCLGMTARDRARVRAQLRSGGRLVAFHPMNDAGRVRVVRVEAGAATSRIGDKEAREIIIRAYRQLTGTRPTPPVAQAAQAVARGESYYGQAWGAAGAGSNNWGAVQSGRPPCGSGEFLYTDTHPNPDGSSTPYEICFRRYASPEDGAADFLRIMYFGNPARKAGTLEAAKRGHLRGISGGMYDAGYFEGFGPDREARVRNHMKALRANAEGIAKNVGEPVYLLNDDEYQTSRIVDVAVPVAAGLFGIGVGVYVALEQRKAAA